MNTTPEITVFMPVYNAEKYLRESIESVLSQTYQDFEFLIIDDGSIDRSRDIIQSYRDDRIIFKALNHNFIDTLNKGLEIADGKYVARMDADDIMLPERLQVQYEYMESNPDVDACGGYIEFIDYKDCQLKRPTSPDELLTTLILYSPIANPTSMIRKKRIVDNKIRYQHKYIYAEDYKFWTEVAKYGKLANIPQVLLKYRTSKTQVSTVYSKEQAELTQEIQKEMIEFFMSHLNKDYEYTYKIENVLIPSLEELLRKSYTTFEEYSKFMYSLICGLRVKNLIDV